MNILLVDDQALDRALLRAPLEAEHFRVLEAEDGLSALALLEREPVDAVISDLLMPRMDGITLCRELRRREEFRRLPYIIYTGVYDSTGDETAAREAGTDRYLIKPQTSEVLLGALRDVLAGGGRPAAHAATAADLGVMREYNAVLIRRLEEKNTELAAKVGSLIEAEHQLQLQSAALEHAANAILITDAAGNILWANPAFATMTGYAVEEVVGRNPRILRSGFHDEAHYRDLWATIQAGKIWRGEFVNRRKDGTLYTGEQTITPVRARTGEITNFVGIVNDVTASRRAEIELYESEQRYRMLFQANPHPMWVYDVETLQFLAVNDAAVQHYGFSREEFLAMTIREIRPPEAIPQLLNDLAQPRQGISSGAHWQHRKRNGEVIEVEIAAHDVMFGGRRGRVVLANDITERKRTEETLERERLLLRTLIDQIPDPIYVKDRDSRFILSNASLARFMGVRAPEDLLGRCDVEFYRPELAAKFRADERRVLRGEALINLEEKVPAGDGTIRTVLTTKLPLRDSSGHVTSVVGVGHDITEREMADAAVRVAEQKFRKIFENTLEGLYQTTPDGRFLSANPALARMLGYASSEELIAGRTDIGAQGYVDPRRREEFKRLMESPGVVNGFEYQVRRKEGSVIWVSENAHAVRAPDGALLHYEGSMIDITAQKRAAEERSRISRQMELLLESTGEGIFGLDLAGTCTFINRAGVEMIGRTTAEVLGRPMHELVQHHRATGELYPADKNPILEALRAGQRCRVDSDVFWRSDGSSFPVEFASYPIIDDGRVTGAVVTFTDVTEKKKLQNELLRAQRVESVGRLATGIAHDMNNILAPIMMSVPLLRMPLSPQDVDNTLASIERSAKRGADLVKQLLTFGRGVEGGRGAVNPGELIREILKVARETFPKNITFALDIAPNVSAVRGDASQLHQVLLNLCVNARDAMPRGGTLAVAAANVDVEERIAQQHSGARSGAHVRLSVTDTGSGMPPEVADRIFDPFFTTKAAGQGTGLGLSTVLGIVKSHGGFLTLRTEVNRGTSFDIFLPAAVGDEPVARGPTAMPPRGHGEMILVVDDEESIRRVLGQTLNRHNYQVITAADGADGVRAFTERAGRFHLVVTDLDMPHMDGLKFIRAVRQISPKVKVLISSGLMPPPTDPRFAELTALNATALLRKPFGTDEILAAVHAALAGK